MPGEEPHHPPPPPLPSQPSDTTEGILCATSKEPKKEHKQNKSILHCTAMPIFSVVGRMLKRPHSIKDGREDGEQAWFSPLGQTKLQMIQRLRCFLFLLNYYN